MKVRGPAYLAAVVTAFAAVVGGSGAAPAPPVHVVLYSDVESVEAKTEGLECALGFRSVQRFNWVSLPGLAARLSPLQTRRLRLDRDIRRVYRGRAAYVVALRLASASPAVERRIDALERRHGFRASHRYNTRSFRGFAAQLTTTQLAALASEPDVLTANTDPEMYLVYYVRGTDVHARTAELERKYGFTGASRLSGLEAFGASLLASHLTGIASESDVQWIFARGYGKASFGPWPAEPRCLRATPAVRRALTVAAARRYGRTTRISGRIRYGSYLGAEYALATVSKRNRPLGRQPERFERPAGSSWLHRGPTNGTVCATEIPLPVLESWLLEPASDENCFRAR